IGARLGRATHARAGQRIVCARRMADDRPDDVVIPAVGIVVRDDHCRVLPGLEVLEVVDRVDEQHFLVDTINHLQHLKTWKNPAGRLPASAAAQKSLRSYWWFA